MHRQYGGQRPSVEFFCKAYLRMVQHFQARIRMYRHTLKACTDDWGGLPPQESPLPVPRPQGGLGGFAVQSLAFRGAILISSERN